MRILTLNLNGIRSAAKKGFFKWLKTQPIDIVCLQETRAQEHQLEAKLHPEGYYAYFFDAEKPGYSGVAIYTRRKPNKLVYGLDWLPMDREGRYLQADFGNLSVASLYLPSGSSSEVRQQFKFECLDFYRKVLEMQARDKRDYVLCGDWNIAHKPIDLKNWRANQKHSGFLPEERAWMDWVLDKMGYIDAFRVINSAAEQYTWWSNRGRAWEKNVGWRIDYQIISPRLKPLVKSATIYKSQRFSDHAPLILDYTLSSEK